MPQSEEAIIVEVLDERLSLADLVVEKLPEILFKWELGGITDPLGQLIGWLWSQVKTAIDLLSSSISGWIGAVRTLINSVSSTITSAISSVSTSISGLGTLISGISTSLSTIYTGILNSITTALGGVSRTLQGFSTYFSSLASSIASLSSSILTGISSAFASIRTWLTSAIAGLQTGLASLSGMVTSVSSAVGSGFSSLASSLSKVASTISSTLQSAVTSIVQAVTTIQQYLTTLGTTVAGAITQVVQAIPSLGKQIWDGILGLKDSIVQTISSIASTLSNIGSSIVSSVQSAFTSIGQGLSAVQAFLGTLGTTVTGAISGVVQSLTSIGKQIWDGILGFKDWLVSGLATIGTVLGGLGTTISTFITSIPKTLSEFWAWIEGGWNKFVEGVGNTWNSAVKWMTDTVAEVNRKAGEVHTTLMGFFNPLIGIGEALKSLANSVIAFLKDPWGGIKETLGKAFEPILKPLQGLWDTLVAFKEALVNFLKDPLGTIKSFLAPILDFLKEPLKPLKETIKYLVSSFWDFFAVMSGATVSGESVIVYTPVLYTGRGTATNWPASIIREGVEHALRATFDSLWNVIEGGLTWIKEKTSPIIDQLWSAISQAGSWVVGKLQDVFNLAWGGIKTVVSVVGKTIVDSIATFVELGTAVVGGVKDLLMNLYMSVVNATGTFTSKFFKELTERILKGESKGEWVEMAGFVGIIASTQFVFRWASNILWNIGQLTREVELNLDGILAPLGLGMEGRFKYKMQLGWILTHIATELQKYPDELASAMIYGTAIWLSQPFAKLMSSTARNYIPVQLPNLPEIIEMTRRSMPTEELPKMVDYSHWAMSLYGYADTVVEAYTEPPEGVWKVDVQDRFGKPRILPRSLVYDLPTATDMARMMVRDIFGPPENPFPSFATAIAMRGMTSDVAKMYYLLHFRYPTMDNLWEFTMRCASGMAWVPDAPNLEEDLGASGGKSPVALNAPSTTIAGLKSFVTGFLSKYIKPYAKWHDYAPFPWTQDFTSDRLIMLDLMARLPDKIDARWMYKWSVVEDSDLMRMVVAHGYHPDWVEPISVSEAMNALAEERSYLRTGVLNAYEQGFMASTQVDKIFQNITTVFILGKERTVKFLEGERKLLIIRHTWDRALNVLNALWRNLVSGFQRSMITDSKMLATIKSTVTNIAKVVGVDLATDEQYLSAWIQSLAVRRDFETVQRIRGWMRIFIYRATQLAESGEAYEDIVERYANVAMLTQTETQIMLDLGKAFIDAYKRNRSLAIIKNMVKGKLRSGNMTIDVAIETLVKAGMDKQDAIVWLESEVKPRVVSVDKLISMKKLIPIELDLLKQKMNAEGVPKDEQALYLPYAVAQELGSDMQKEATEMINDYVKAGITEEQLKADLDNLATLNGTAKTTLGVDWIVLSPEERQLLISIAKRRRARVTIPTLKEKLFTTEKLFSLQEVVPVATEKIQEAMIREGVLPEDQKMYLAYGVGSELREEIERISTELITEYGTGRITKERFTTDLNNLATLGGTVKESLGVDWIVLSPEERQLLITLGEMRRTRMPVEEEKVKMMTTEKVVSLQELIPVASKKIREVMAREGIPPDEQKMYLAYGVASELKDEMGRIVTDLIADFAKRIINETQFKKALDDLATLNGSVPELLEIPWIVYSPQERQMLYSVALLRRMRTKPATV